MELWASIKAFTSQNPELINLISLAIGVAGIVLAFVFYNRAKPVKRLAFATRTFRVISERHRSVVGLIVKMDGRVVPALSVTRLAVWNAGTETLRGEDFPSVDPLHIVSRRDSDVIKAKVLETSRDVIQVEIATSAVSVKSASVSLAFLDPGDGFLI